MRVPSLRRVTLPVAALLLGASATAEDQGPGPVTLDPSRGSEIGLVYEAFLSPYQESNEEENTPKGVPDIFRSTTPSVSRDARAAAGHRGHGVIRFTRDLSRAYVDIQLEGVNPAEINMFHIHCGQPGILGPILVDFSHMTDLKTDLADNTLSLVVTDDALAATIDHAHGVVGAFTAGCVIPSPTLEQKTTPRVRTVAGMAALAEAGDLYFNVHTTGQTYYGDMRGQWWPQDD